MGGDIVGKALVPIELSKNGASAVFRGRSYRFESENSLPTFEEDVRNAGFYPIRITREEYQHLSGNELDRGALFERVVCESLKRWLEIAEDKQDSNVRVFVMAGNDDPWFVDDELARSRSILQCDNRIVRLDGLEMLSLSYSNQTPWNSPRELDEDALFGLIAKLAADLEDPESAIFNLHVPPLDSGLDVAPLLDSTLRPRTQLGQPEMGPVGSEAVRRAIELYQPAMSLHGHIHESRGIQRIGRTVALNPGSEYTVGRLHGALFEITKGRVTRHQLVSG
jgi:uncharacterized protein